MKTVVEGPAAEMSLLPLKPDEVRKVQAWYEYLARWDENELVRKSAIPLPNHKGVYVLRTSTDLRIYFRIDGDTVTVLDVANQAAILATAGGGVGGSAPVTSILERKTSE